MFLLLYLLTVLTKLLSVQLGMAGTEPILEEALFGWLGGLTRFEEFSQHLVQVITVNHHHHHHHHHHHLFKHAL